MERNKKIIILLLNIMVFLILFLIVFSFQKYFYLVYHDYLIPYLIKGRLPDWGRIPASIIYKLTKIVLPDFLSIHPQDFISGIEAIIKSISFLCICTVTSIGFFAMAKEKFKIINIENLFILPAIFFLMGIPITNQNCYNVYFGKMEESVVFFEYFFSFLFYFLFVIFLLYIFLTQRKISLLLKILIIINSFLLGIWVEILNVATFFFIIIFTILISIYNKNLLHNKNFFLLIISFLVGCFSFYIFSNYISGTKIVGYSYDWSNLIYNIKINLFDFIQAYIMEIFVSKVYFYIIIIVLSVCLWKRRNYIINIILITCFSLLLGYLMMNLSLIIFRETPDINYSGFLFQRELYQFLYVCVLEFIIVLLTGAFYFTYSSLRKVILTIILIINIILLSIFIKNDICIQEEKKDIKMFIYNMEKTLLVYNLLGETAILPVSYLKQEKVFSREIFMFDDKYRFEREFSDYDIDKYCILMKNRYFDSYYLLHRYYLINEYNRKFIGVIFVDDERAKKELEKRLVLLNIKKETKSDILKDDISFNKLNYYKKYHLSLSNIKKNNVTKENKIILLKAEAYLNYKNGKLEKALDLYLKYLKKNSKDIDALRNIADIYERLNDIRNAERIYLKLHKLDKNNLTFLYKLMKIYYYHKKDYKKALNTCNEMIKIQGNMLNLYINKAIIYLALKDKKKAKKIFKYVEEKDVNTLNTFLDNSKIKELDDVYNQKVFLIQEPTF